MRPFHYCSIVYLLLAATLIFGAAQYQWPLWWILVPTVIYIHALILGAIFINWNFYLTSLHRGKNKPWLALSFDDGPAGETSAILDVLRKMEVPAAFFSIGKNAAAYPGIVKRWYDEGHLVGNHSFNHGFNFDWQSVRAMKQEIEATNQLISDIIGKKPLFFRPPYGVTNPNLAKAVKLAGMYSIGWSVRSFDTTAKDPQQLLNRILSKIKSGDIILLHDSMPVTHEILTELIVQARQKGFTFVRLDQMLGIDAYA